MFDWSSVPAESTMMTEQPATVHSRVKPKLDDIHDTHDIFGVTDSSCERGAA
jgi:hypothetical protein